MQEVMYVTKRYDVIVIGAGPAGIFTGLELAGAGLSTLILEKGRDIVSRRCPINHYSGKCLRCKPCDILCGWGGAGAFSDGKLTLTTEFGGVLDEYMEKSRVAELIEYIDKIYLDFGATTTVYGDDKQDEIRRLQRVAAAADLNLIPARIRHLGTEKCTEILTRMREYLDDKCEIRTCAAVEEIVVKNGEYLGVVLAGGEMIESKYLVAAPGREGAEWFAGQAAGSACR
jgi:uncharacterized FAD-dependent dehydrogenase